MERTGPFEYKVAKDEKICFTIEPDQTPMQVTPDDKLTETVDTPQQIRAWFQASTNTNITNVYAFPTPPPDGAKYTVTIQGATGGPDVSRVRPPGAGSSKVITYRFTVPTDKTGTG
jgi:hypothetical protein